MNYYIITKQIVIMKNLLMRRLAYPRGRDAIDWALGIAEEKISISNLHTCP